MSTQVRKSASSPAALTAEGCHQRQTALLRRLNERGVDAALIIGRRNVHYFTGHWTRSVFPAAALLRMDQTALVAAPVNGHAPAADTLVFKGDDYGTLRDNGLDIAVTTLLEHIDASRPLACDQAVAARPTIPIANDLLSLRRTKWPDEIALLRRAVAAAEAAYAAAAKLIRPGVTEFELFAEVMSAATLAAGEPIGEMGNDFRSGAPGGSPRERAMQAGELIPLDLGINLRGYTADLCRTFAVDRQPAALQIEAHGRVTEVLEEIESQLRPGASCRDLYSYAKYRLSAIEWATFGHHLGHGVGMAAHEAPRLNPDSNDVLAAGDVFTIEPGLYAPELKAGVRVEQMFHITPNGAERLSSFPVGLTHD